MRSMQDEQPDSLGGLIDALALIRDDKAAATAAFNQLIKEMSLDEEDIKDQLFDALKAGKLRGGLGSNVQAIIRPKSHYSLSNKEALVAFAKANDAFDIFTSRLNSRAIKDRIKAGVDVSEMGVRDWESLEIVLKPIKS